MHCKKAVKGCLPLTYLYNMRSLSSRITENNQNDSLCEADANQNNGCISKKPAVTDSTGTEGPHPPGTPPTTADPDEATPRPHLVRLFSRDAPGREDNTFKERPSESDELQTIQEHSGAASESLYLRDKTILDHIGKIFGGDKKKKSKVR
uniref:Myelin basic protein n=1 Tax=Periophthalmus magnuspinnatus TaxID=409849 RepID=A0A3B4AWI5_9GOBI